tara:strand:- start:2492 stop:3502 length:1011 start_codon:yes stop_codon:yes gene_type:complete
MKIEDLEKIDSKKMFRVYDQCYENSKLSYEQDFSIPDFKNIDHIVFAGMGGSGTIGDVFSSILSQNDIHTTVVKGYLLPKTVDTNTLVVTTSISGNTKETLTVLQNSLKTDAKILAFSSGGKMGELVKNNRNIKYFKINQIHSPRASFFGFLYSTLNILQGILPIKKSDINNSLNELKILQNKIGSSNLVEENPALDLAKWIKEIPLIYYPSGLQSAATRFKNSLQENAKMHVITEDVVEASHNGIVAWEGQRNVQPILLQGKDDYEKTRERWGIIKKFFEEEGIDYREVFSNNGKILSKIVCLIYFLDYVSIYRSIFSGIDPSPVIPIDFIKKKL